MFSRVAASQIASALDKLTIGNTEPAPPAGPTPHPPLPRRPRCRVSRGAASSSTPRHRASSRRLRLRTTRRRQRAGPSQPESKWEAMVARWKRKWNRPHPHHLYQRTCRETPPNRLLYRAATHRAAARRTPPHGPRAPTLQPSSPTWELPPPLPRQSIPSQRRRPSSLTLASSRPRRPKGHRSSSRHSSSSRKTRKRLQQDSERFQDSERKTGNASKRGSSNSGSGSRGR